MKKKLLSAILAALMLASSFASCSDSNAGTNTDETKAANAGQQNAAAEETVNTEELTDLEKRQMIPDDLPDVQYDGKAFVVLTETSTAADYAGEIAVEEITGDACNDAIYNRNIKIEDRFDVKISSMTNDNPQSQAATLAQAGTEDYQLLAFHDYLSYTPISAQALLNWCETPYQNLDKPWHNKLANDQATINNHLWTICSDLSYTSMTFTHAIFANLDLLDQYGYQASDIYGIVKEGKWTIDNFKSMISEMYQDTNGNGTADTADLFGFGYYICNPADVWFTAFGETITKKNDEGKLDLAFMSDKTVSMVEKLMSMHYDFPGYLKLSTQYDEEIWFTNNQLVFAPMRFQAAYTDLREMEAAYTMLPFPKWDEAQSNYYTNADDKFSVFGLPMPSYNSLEFCSVIFEALCAESYKTVYPTYYDTALKGKYSTDQETAEMVDLVIAGRNFDFTFQFGETIFLRIPYMIRDCLLNENPNISSSYKKIQKSLNKGLDKKFYKLYGFEE
ncbi:MAG: hypothetical protein IJY35_09325 [Clostridia bacterium]|nr:hypothetical protein [Clostridia bacterium]